MANTPNLNMPLLSASQAQKHVTHNEALRVVDALLRTRVLDQNLTAPPGAPADGDIYIVAGTATGDWVGKEDELAYYETNAWKFYPPVAGQLVYVVDESKTYQYDGSNWVEFVSGSGGGGAGTWDAPSLEADYSGVGDDSTNNTTAINSAISSGEATYVPHGVFKTTSLAPADLTTRFWGDGQIRTSDTYKRGRYFSLVDAAPSSTASRDSIATAFNGDISGVQFPVEHRITGTATVGQPSTGYTYTHEAFPHYTHLRNDSGHNESTSGNGGRTGVCAYQTKVDQQGQGDAVAYNALVFVTGTKSGSTNFLANPAGVMLNGSISPGADGVYLNTVEFDMQDSGYDVAGIGTVTNLHRTVGTGAKEAVWMGHRVQSLGSTEADVAYSAAGSTGYKIGLDLGMTNFNAAGGNRAIAMKSGQRIYFNATSSNGWYSNNSGNESLYYDGSKMVMAAGNQPVIQAQSTNVLLAPSGTGKLQATTSGVQVANDFEVSPSIGSGTNWFRVNSGGANCGGGLEVNGPINLYGSGIFTSTLVSAPTIAIIFKINGVQYKVNAQTV